MTRADAKQNLVALGIEEPTEAQVTNYLNQFHNNEPQPQPQPQPTPAPQTQPSPTPTEPDDSDEITTLKEQLANLQSENIQKDIKAYAAEKGLAGEQAAKILAGFKDNLELAKAAIDSMSEIITERETAAAESKEKEIADNSMNPGGGSADGGGKEKSEAEKVAETIGKDLAGINETAKATVESYM